MLWQVCAGSWWNTVATSDSILFGTYRTPTAWTMTASPFDVALSIGCRNSRIPLGERTISNGNTTAWGPRKGDWPLWGEEEQRNE